LLALDTSSVACSVALLVDDAVSERHEEQPREHTRLLLPMLRSLLSEGALSLQDLDAIVLGNGPGSFIGMRIGASVAQGLAFGAGLDIVPISSLAAVAAEVIASREAGEVIVAQDAHMREVYLGRFRPGDDGLPVALAAERLHALSAIRDAPARPAGPRVAAGDGWRRHPGFLAANAGRFDAISEVRFPRARYLLAPGAAALAAGGALSPRDVVPAYLRQSVATPPAERP
jgi:tRNA threonylcarbamoyladenosine biosynthesis protein TsaB